MKVIIIGSKGFIGNRLYRYFQKTGLDIWGADVIIDYTESDRYFLIDETNSDFRDIFKRQEFDVCLNCSGAASVPDSIRNPMRDFYLNTVNVFRLLEAIRDIQPKCRFINLSSAAVYGNPVFLPVNENANALPLSPYGIHKLQAEQICREFSSHFGINTCSLRLFSVFGEGLKKQLFWDLYKKAKTGKPVVLFGTGNESRDFIHIDDLVRAIGSVVECSEFKFDVINIANGMEISIKEAVAIFFSFFKKEISCTYSGEIREGDPANWLADIARLESYGYKPEIDMKSGLERYYKWISDSY